MAWLTADFSQAYRAFDLEEGRKAMREIVGMFFIGASFFRSTGLYKRALSGGLGVLLFQPFFDPSKQAAELAEFKEKVRACAKELATFFAQESVAAVVQEPSGHIRIDFVGARSPVNPDQFISSRDRTRIRAIRSRVRLTKRLPGSVVGGD